MDEPSHLETPVHTVEIPAYAQHQGLYAMRVRLEWICPRCGGLRGDIYRTVSFDGSRRLAVDGWKNACGHIDRYDEVRVEARTNGLNDIAARDEPAFDRDLWNALWDRTRTVP